MRGGAGVGYIALAWAASMEEFEMIRIVCIIPLIVIVASAATADQYWIAYEGDGWPEDEGWWHIWGDEQAHRWIEDGALVIDSLHDIGIADFYEMHMNGQLDPEPGETFVLQWRLLVQQVVGFRDPGLGVFSDEMWAVGFEFDEGSILSVFEYGVAAKFEPGIFHRFELRSGDMRHYDLWIDGEPAMSGDFWHALSRSTVGWGDFVQGSASLSRWDYVRFGVVPEPESATLLWLGVLAWRNLR
jgi:hypothetical protein